MASMCYFQMCWKTISFPLFIMLSFLLLVLWRNKRGNDMQHDIIICNLSQIYMYLVIVEKIIKFIWFIFKTDFMPFLHKKNLTLLWLGKIYSN